MLRPDIISPSSASLAISGKTRTPSKLRAKLVARSSLNDTHETALAVATAAVAAADDDHDDAPINGPTPSRAKKLGIVLPNGRPVPMINAGAGATALPPYVCTSMSN